MNSDEIKAVVAQYYRYKQQCSVVCFEANNNCAVWDGEPADVLVIKEGRALYEIEVKVSLADFRHDKVKNKHRSFLNAPTYLPIRYFYFAVPKDIASQVKMECETLYPYAGVLAVPDFQNYLLVMTYRKPRVINPGKLPLKDCLYLIKEQSGTLCRLARDKVEAESRYKEAHKELLELRKQLSLYEVKA
jgi:hypothetical protein